MTKRYEEYACRMLRVTAFSLIVTASYVAAGHRSEPARGDAKFTYHQRLVFVTGHIKDKVDVLCLLDTGANVSAIDRNPRLLHFEALASTICARTLSSHLAMRERYHGARW